MEEFPLGGIISLAILLPNLLAVFFPPTLRSANAPLHTDKRLQVMTLVERIGQASSYVIPFFYKLSLANTLDFLVLGLMSSSLILYYAGWIRYISLGRDEVLFYRSLLGIPLPMAVMPVVYFFAAAIFLESVWLLIASIALGIGHLSISWLQFRSIE